MIDLAQWWSALVIWLSDHAVTPVLTFLHVGTLAGDPHEIAEAALIALLQVGFIALIFRPLESVLPAERWVDRRLTRVDWQYTLLMLFGLFPLFTFIVLTPFANLLGGSDGAAAGEAAASGVKAWLPWFQDHPYLLFGFYYLVYDFVYYWMHRTQHAIPWWWALHSMHHSQRQMSCWTNDRGSVLDGALQSIILATVGLVMGVDPAQFALLMLIGELVQNLSHTNVRIGFGRVLDKVFVDPKFHRLHHMVVVADRPNLHYCNFGQVLTIWDRLFGTALYGEPPHPTGVSDPVIDADNTRNLLQLQWYTLKRFWGAVRRPAGWKLGEVAFGPDYEPIPVRHAEPARSATLDPARPAAERVGALPERVDAAHR